jgi:hypothetical protein
MGTSRIAAKINTATNLRIFPVTGAGSPPAGRAGTFTLKAPVRTWASSPLEIGDRRNADSGESILRTYRATQNNGAKPSAVRPSNKIRLCLPVFGSASTNAISAFAKLLLAAATTTPAAARPNEVSFPAV